MNDGKICKSFEYPESFLAMLLYMHTSYHTIPYRQLEGFARALTIYVNGLKAPDYTTIAWRIAEINIKIDHHLMKWMIQ